MQSRAMSAAETVASVAVGYAVSAAVTYAVLPLFGYAVPMADALGISAVFTAVSIVRQYAIRRAFNAWAKPAPQEKGLRHA